MRKIIETAKLYNWNREETIKAIKVACGLIESGELCINFKKEKTIAPGNTCGPAVDMAYSIWEELKILEEGRKGSIND